MNKTKAAMNLAIVAKLMDKMLFEKTDEMTVSKKWYREELVPKFARRAASLIYDADVLFKMGMPTTLIPSAVFLKERLGDVIENKDCANCPAKDICEDKHCATEKDPANLTNDEINQMLDELKRHNEK